MNITKSTCEELEQRCRTAEAMLDAIRSGQADAIIGERGILVLRLAEAEERAEHIKQVLMAIRKVNQLIAQETKPDQFIEDVCANLTEALGYHNAWIALLNETATRAVLVASSCLAEEFDEMRVLLENGDFPACMVKALGQEDTVLFSESNTECAGCRLAGQHGGRAQLARRLAFGERLFGILVVSVPMKYVKDSEEQALFRELTEDLAFALQKIEMKKRREAAERDIVDILESISDAFLALDDQLDVIYCNAPACRHLGRNSADVVGKPVFQSFPEMRGSIFETKIHEVIASGQSTSFEICFATPPHHDWYDVRVYPRGKGVSVYFLVTTARKRAEEEKEKLQARLTQVRKMESVGRLAGGVAHDFNNMLGVILGHADMAMDQVGIDQPLYADLQEISRAARRSADLVRQLLGFARKQAISPKVLDINKTVASMLAMLKRLTGENIRFNWLPGKDVWPVKMDPAQIDQLLVNLCGNARDATNGMGIITIETGNVFFDDDYCVGQPEFVPGEFVLLAVSDDGCGMDEETLQKIFEPFFTTKELGKGTGLGLATVYGIVKQNNGFINVFSKPGKGTTFKIYLARHKEKFGQTRTDDSTAGDDVCQGTVMVVEDEPAILKLTTTILGARGYAVMAASTPKEALRQAERFKGEIHLLITDVILPEMNGQEMAKKLKVLYPQVRCLFMSGYTADFISHHGVLEENLNFLQKPFSIRDLLAKVKSVLA